MLTSKSKQALAFCCRVSYFLKLSSSGECFKGIRLCSSFLSKQKRSTADKIEVKDKLLPFAGSRSGCFFQDPPELGNTFTRDSHLRACIKRILPKKVLEEILPDLKQFGNQVSTKIQLMGIDCELRPPTLEHFDAWGRRVDRINTCEGWKQLHDVSAEEGLMAIAYERKHRQWSRLYQVIKLYLFSPSSGLYSCPLAMTDGAAKTLEKCKPSEGIFQQAYNRLTSRDPSQFWTSGQWMTERKGGSDVGNGTETIAVLQSDGTYSLHGYKWFSSATDADMSLTLARVQQPNGSVIPNSLSYFYARAKRDRFSKYGSSRFRNVGTVTPALITVGSKGLTMFYLETRDSDGNLNNIEVQRLKNKLGTKQLPTAELLLNGTIAQKITDEGRGVSGIAKMLTITRIHNSISAASAMRRILSLAQDYCLKRTVFGKLLVEHELHMQTLARLEVEVRGAVLLILEVSRLLGLEDCEMANEEELHLLRLLTPITKLYTAKQAMIVTSEGLESFGGQGYIEDTGLPGIMRDAQVLPIWEGTTNVLSLDILRSINKSQGQVLKAFQSSVLFKLSLADDRPTLQSTCNAVRKAVDSLMSANTFKRPVMARDLAYSLAKIFVGALFIEHASWEGASITDMEAAKRWCLQDLTPVLTNLKANLFDTTSISLDNSLVMDRHPL